MISNMAAGNISIKTGFKGVNFAPVTACATSSHAAGEAFRNTKYGVVDACVTGGAEAAITPMALAGFNNMAALTDADDPLRASIPFDAERSGFVMGEGGTILMVSHDVEFCARFATHAALFFDGDVTAVQTARQFFAGNQFYTTAAARMSRTVFPDTVTNEEVIARCSEMV